MDELAVLLEQLQTRLKESGDVFGATILSEEAATGSSIPKSHLTKIAKWTRVEQSEDTIHTFPVLMIDEAPTRNLVKYTAESQKKSVKGWPGITYLYNAQATDAGGWLSGGGDHQLKANSQFARLYDSQVVKTPKGLIGTLGWLYSVSGLSEELDSWIGKTEAGIHREVSIHVSVPGGVCCSICNDAFSNCTENTKSKANPNGTQHYPGEKYGKETCYMSTGSGILIPLELSAVACPGSVNAHVMQDEEVTSYQPVSMREALNGGPSKKIVIPVPNPPISQENIVDETQARLKLLELAKAAGVQLSEFIADPKNVDPVKLANVTSENFTEHFTPEQIAEAAPIIVPATPPKPKVRSLFSENATCPMCKRTGTEGSATDEETIRAEYQALLTEAISAAEEKVATAEAAVAELPKLKEEHEAMFADMVESTVTLAIKKGVKKSEEADAYRETLKALSYGAVKEVRAPLLAMATPDAPPGTKSQEKLVESMEQRAKRNLGSTKVETDAEGRKYTNTNHRPRMAAR